MQCGIKEGVGLCGFFVKIFFGLIQITTLPYMYMQKLLIFFLGCFLNPCAKKNENLARSLRSASGSTCDSLVREVCRCKESLQGTLEPLYLPRTRAPQCTEWTRYHTVRRAARTHQKSSSQGVVFFSLCLLISVCSITIHHTEGCTSRPCNTPLLTCVSCSSLPSSLKQR